MPPVSFVLTIKTASQTRQIVGSATPILLNGNGFTSSTRITDNYVTGHIDFSEDLGEVLIEAGKTGDLKKLVLKVQSKAGAMLSYRFALEE